VGTRQSYKERVTSRANPRIRSNGFPSYRCAMLSQTRVFCSLSPRRGCLRRAPNQREFAGERRLLLRFLYLTQPLEDAERCLVADYHPLGRTSLLEAMEHHQESRESLVQGVSEGPDQQLGVIQAGLI
jgi:hypothetical protein